MGSLRKRRTKKGFRYVLDFRDRGKRRVITLKTSNRKVAEQAKAEIEAKIVLGTFGAERQGGKDVFFSDFLKIYFDAVRGTKKESTLALEKIHTKTFIQVIGNKPLGAISTEVIERWQHDRL